MNQLSRFKKSTTVKFSSNTFKLLFSFFVLCIFFSDTPSASEVTPERQRVIDAEARARVDAERDARNGNSRNDDTCGSISSTFREQWRKVAQYCSATGQPQSNCRRTIEDCQGKVNDLVAASSSAREGQGSIVNSLFQTAAGALGGAYGTALSSVSDPAAGLRGVSDGCPRLGSRDYQERKRNAERDLKEAEKELKEAEKKIADAQKKFGEDSVKIQERLAEAQEKFEEEKLEMTEKNRESIQGKLREQSELAARIRTVNSEMLQLRTQQTQAMRQHAASMVSYSESVFRRSCMREVEKIRKEIYGANSNAGRSQGNFLKAGVDRRRDLQAAYDTCLSKLDQEKAQQIENARAQQQQIELQIQTKEAELTQLNEDVSAAQVEMTRLQQELGTLLNDKQKRLVEKITQLQQELTNLQNNTQKEIQNINLEIQRIQNRMNVARVELASLGPEPADGGSSGSGPSYSEAAAAMGESVSLSNRFRRTCGSRECSGSSSEMICSLGDAALGGGEGGTAPGTPAAGASVRPAPGAGGAAAAPPAATAGRPAGQPRQAAPPAGQQRR